MEFLFCTKTFFGMGAVYGFLAVSLGAFGAHALKERLTPDLAAVFETGVRYQMYHALALMVTALAFSFSANNWIGVAGWLFCFGTLIFSGSLYMLALSGIRTWGAITPIGGLFLLAAWLCLFIGTVKK